MCENCDLESRQPPGQAADIHYSYGYFNRKRLYNTRLSVIHWSLWITKPLTTIILCTFLASHIHQFPGPDREAPKATSSYNHDQLFRGFDQYGCGIFLRFTRRSNNITKSAVFRQRFDKPHRVITRLSVATIVFSFIETAFLSYIFLTGYGTSPLCTGEWPKYQRHQGPRQTKSHSLRRKLWTAIEALHLVLPTAAHLGTSVALVAVHVVLVNAIRADPVMAAYMSQIQNACPEITNQMIETSLTDCFLLVHASLALTVVQATATIAALLCERLGIPGPRRRSVSNGNGICEGDGCVSLEDRQVSESAEDEWVDTGPLAQVYKRQMENIGGGVGTVI